jgi:hypothetical protein
VNKLWLVPLALVVAGAIAVAAMHFSTPSDLDYSLSHASEEGLYQVTLTPGIDPVPMGQIHDWRVAVDRRAKLTD